jgi:hypothetical protein
MLHHVVAADDPCFNEASALERLDYLRSRYNRDIARHKAGSCQKSGHVKCQSQLVGWPHHFEQGSERSAQVSDRLIRRRPVTGRADARPELGRGAPDAVLVLLNDVGHVNGLGHVPIMHGLSGLGNRDYVSSDRDVLGRLELPSTLEAGQAWQGNDLVFCTGVGTALDAANVRRSFRRITKAAGLGANWTPRELRHSFVSIMSDNGVTIEQIADLVGHRTTIVTQKVYRHQLKPVISMGATAMNIIFSEKSA